MAGNHGKVSFFGECTKMQLITSQNFNIQNCFSQFLWFFSFKVWFKGQIISRIHLILPDAYKLMCFGRNINGNRDVKFLECDYLLVQRCVKLTSVGIFFSSDNVMGFADAAWALLQGHIQFIQLCQIMVFEKWSKGVTILSMVSHLCI